MVQSFASLLLLCILFALEVKGQEDAQIPLNSEGSGTDCHNACTSLINVLGGKAHYRDMPPTLFVDYYSDQQRETVPACVVLPDSAQDVSDAIKAITQYECIFAVKSGGHAMFSGASNAPGGITLDLRNLNMLHISKDRKTTSIGPGNRWIDVYDYLDPFNVTVVGGRDAQVGVGGFLLGGGISFISRRHGWGADNVYNYELVLANGTISNINQAANPDLYWALRGGGKNFGVVTRFDVYNHVDTPMWGGCDVMLLSDVSEQLSSLGIPRQFSWTPTDLIEKSLGAVTTLACKLGYCVGFNDVAGMLGEIGVEAETDIFAHAYGVICFFSIVQTYVLVGQMNHGKGLEGAPGFGTMHRAKKIWASDRIAKTTDFARELKSLNSARQRVSYETATFKLDTDLMKEITNIYMEETEKIRHLKGMVSALPMQIITKAEIAHFQKNGGNCLGISPDDGPLMLLETTIAWKDPKDDEITLQASKNILDRSVALAKERGLWHPFLYQNYAGKRQPVFESYGAKNLARLRSIRDEYDPDHVFTKLYPGYFNL